MFLVRTAFWLALIVMILPSDPAQQARLYQTASNALHQAATFCDRNKTLCTQAQAQWVVFQAKLAVGARMAMDLVNERIAGSPPRTLADAPAPQPAIDTLSPADRSIGWKRPARSQL